MQLLMSLALSTPFHMHRGTLCEQGRRVFAQLCSTLSAKRVVSVESQVVLVRHLCASHVCAVIVCRCYMEEWPASKPVLDTVLVAESVIAVSCMLLWFHRMIAVSAADVG